MSAPEPPVLTSTANPTIKRLLRLRKNRARRKSRRVIVDGWRETARAIQGGLNMCGLFLPDHNGPDHSESDQNSAGQEQWAADVIDHASAGALLNRVSAPLMEKISYGQTPRGVVAEFELPDRPLERLCLPESPFVLVLDAIEKPGNIGAVFRAADAAGVDAIMLTSGGDPWNPNAIRNSLGAVFVVPFAIGESEEAAAYLAQRKIRPLAARVEAAQSLWAADLTGPLAVILGSEATGLAERWREIDGQPVEGVCIPMAGEIDSLNIATSAAVIAFEAARIRGLGR